MFTWTWFRSGRQSWNENPSHRPIFGTWKDGTDKTLLEEDIPDLVVYLVQHRNPHNDEQESSSTDRYWLCESWDVTVCELQSALTKVAAIVRAKETHI